MDHPSKTLKSWNNCKQQTFFTRRCFEIIYAFYSWLFHLQPHRFHCVGGCWDRTQDWLRLRYWQPDALTAWLEPVLGIRIRMFLGLPDPDRLVKRYGSGPGSGSFPFLINVLSGLKQCLQNKILTQNYSQIKFFRLKMMCLGASYKKKI